MPNLHHVPNGLARPLALCNDTLYCHSLPLTTFNLQPLLTTKHYIFNMPIIYRPVCITRLHGIYFVIQRRSGADIILVLFVNEERKKNLL